MDHKRCRYAIPHRIQDVSVPARVLTASLALPRAGYAAGQSVRTFHQSLYARISALPGVRSAALTIDLPLEQYENRAFTPEGAQASGGVRPTTTLSWIHGPYFQTLRIALKRGRFFSEAEYAESRSVVIINERLAEGIWPGQDAVGNRLKWGVNAQSPAPWLTVVGVVADVADGPIGVEPRIHVYEPFRQFPDSMLNNAPGLFGRHVKVALLTDGDPLALVSTVRREMGRLDRQLAIEGITPMTQRVNDVVAPRRLRRIRNPMPFLNGSLTPI